MSTGLYQTHFSRSGDVIHPRNCENLGLGTRLVSDIKLLQIKQLNICLDLAKPATQRCRITRPSGIAMNVVLILFHFLN